MLEHRQATFFHPHLQALHLLWLLLWLLASPHGVHIQGYTLLNS